MPSDMNTQRKEVPPVPTLTDTDKAFMFVNYPRASPDPNAPDWTLDHALDVAGITGSARDAILDATSPDLIRQRFALWRIAQLVGGVADDGDTPEAPGHDVDISNGEDIVDGLHVYYCDAEPNSSPTTTDPGASHAVGGLTEERDWMWVPGTTITWAYQQPDTGDRYTARKRYFEDALETYGHYVNLTFVNGRVGDANLKVWFDDNLKLQSWSFIGNDALDPAARLPKNRKPGGDAARLTTVMLAIPPGGGTANETEYMERTCYHELGHMLGLLHEHEGPRSQVFSWSFTDARSGPHTEFDPDSVMLYPNQRYKPTANDLLKFRQKTEKNTQPSPTDLAFLRVRAPVVSSNRRLNSLITRSCILPTHVRMGQYPFHLLSP